MSVLVNGMQMPQGCSCCPFRKTIGVDKWECHISGEQFDSWEVGWGGIVKRRNDCPLAEVPPHGRLIDADALRKKYFCGENIRHDLITVPVENILYHIDIAPTIIPTNNDSN